MEAGRVSGQLQGKPLWRDKSWREGEAEGRGREEEGENEGATYAIYKRFFFNVSQSQPERVFLSMHDVLRIPSPKHQSHLGKGQVLMGEGEQKAGGKCHWAVTIIMIKIPASLGVICLQSTQGEAEDCERYDTLSQKNKNLAAHQVTQHAGSTQEAGP